MATSIEIPQKVVKLPAALQPVEDLLLWRNKRKTATALLLITATYCLLEWSKTPLLTLFCNVGFFISFGCLVWAASARFLAMAGPAELLPSVLRLGIDEDSVRQLAEKLRLHTNRVLSVVRCIVSGEEASLNLKACAVLFVLGFLGHFATPVGLLFTALLALLTLPKLYEMRKDQVDAGLSTARSHAERHYTTARVKVEEVVSRFASRKPQQAPTPTTVQVDNLDKGE